MALLTTWAEIAWQSDAGTLSTQRDVRGVCTDFLSLCSLQERLSASPYPSLYPGEAVQRDELAAALATLKAAYRHAPGLVNRVLRVANKDFGAAVRLGNELISETCSLSPYYFDFQIAKGLIRKALTAFEYRQLAKLREDAWSAKVAGGIPLCLRAQWDREWQRIAVSSAFETRSETQQPTDAA
jgi:hypothetical protein